MNDLIVSTSQMADSSDTEHCPEVKRSKGSRFSIDQILGKRSSLPANSSAFPGDEQQQEEMEEEEGTNELATKASSNSSRTSAKDSVNTSFESFTNENTTSGKLTLETTTAGDELAESMTKSVDVKFKPLLQPLGLQLGQQHSPTASSRSFESSSSSSSSVSSGAAPAWAHLHHKLGPNLFPSSATTTTAAAGFYANPLLNQANFQNMVRIFLWFWYSFSVRIFFFGTKIFFQVIRVLFRFESAKVQF
jgi:hypothetical protein